MFADLKELYSQLTRQQRKRLLKLQLLIIIMAFAEIAGVISIGPFMAVVGDMGKLEGEGWLAQAFQYSGLESKEAFLTLLGGGVLLVLILAALFSIYTTWRLALYSAGVGADLSSRLYRYYLYQPWLFHSGENSSQLINKSAQEVQRITQRIINPCMQLNARLVMVIMMTLAIFIYNPVVAFSGMLLFITSYFLLYKTVRRILITNGLRISRAQGDRLKLMSEGFGGIKDLLLLHRQPNFTKRFDKASRKWARGLGVTQGLGDAPRYAIELVAFGSIIVLVLYLLNLHEGDLGGILPALSIYALAGFKMLPAFQRIYSSISHIRSNLAAYQAVREDLLASRDIDSRIEQGDTQDVTPLIPQQSIVMQDVVFQYPDKHDAALRGLTLSIPADRMVGLVGTSGSGKSTAVDLLMGLIEPQEGAVLVDGEPITEANVRHWQSSISYVPQHIFLTSSSILENVAFGIAHEYIDRSRVLEALQVAQLGDLVEKLPEGMDTLVGERGIQLSGGQRQRIGIARAIYHDAEVLVLDEATSALDGLTEKRVMDAIHAFSGRKTIIMIAHRLSTVKKCDCIYLMENGKVVDYGNYKSLAKSSLVFQNMIDHA